MKELIKSPISYTGNKYKLLPQLLNHFPKDIETFVDLFCGSGNVFINVEAKNYIINDICWQIIDMIENMKYIGLSFLQVTEIVEEYKLNNQAKEQYLKLREDYNNNKSWDKLYVLTCHSFNNQIRFNKNEGFNMPFGFRTFNSTLKENFKKFVNKLYTMSIGFIADDFKNFRINDLTEKDFVFVDPPYTISNATYNERNAWTKEDDLKLCIYLDTLNKNNIRFAMTNFIEHKGIKNEMIEEFSKRYNVHELSSSYSNCNHQVKNRKSNTKEVLITNY